jgi:hypothetical protein
MLHVSCFTCDHDITSSPYLCSLCHIVLCEKCFLFGAETRSHLRSHPFMKGILNSQDPEKSAVEREVSTIRGKDLASILEMLSHLSLSGMNWEQERQEKLYMDLMISILKLEDPLPAAEIKEEPTPSKPLEPFLLNYNKNRKEFEHEWLPEVEVLLAQSQPLDTPNEFLHAYNFVLKQRNDRKRVILQSEMLKSFNLKRKKTLSSSNGSKKPAEDLQSAILDKLRIFLRPAQELGPGVLEALAGFLYEHGKIKKELEKSNYRENVPDLTESDLTVCENLRVRPQTMIILKMVFKESKTESLEQALKIIKESLGDLEIRTKLASHLLNFS